MLNSVSHTHYTRLPLYIALTGGLLVALILGFLIGTGALFFMIVGTGIIAGTTWVVKARDAWWVPFPAAIALGGYFFVGFKLYLHEAMLLLCLLPLILAIATRKDLVPVVRQKVPVSILLLALYLGLHWLLCLLYNQAEGYGGPGRVSRLYMHAGWPLILFFAFYLFGNSRHLKLVLYLMYFVTLIRFLVGLYFYFRYQGLPTDSEAQLVYIPGVNFVPKMGGPADLRASSILLGAISIVFLSLHRGALLKGCHIAMISIAFVGCLFGGGRAAMGIYLMLILFWFFLYRLWFLLFTGSAMFIAIVIILNVSPQSINAFPESTQRALSILILKDNATDIQATTLASDEFHRRLREAGFERWTESIGSFFFGHGVRPFDEAGWEDLNMDAVTRRVEQAMLTGRFEKGGWSILATFGLVGLILYLNLIRFLVFDGLRILWREKILDVNHAFYFLASFSCISWVLTMFLAGGFPSEEIMLGLFAKVAYEDSKLLKAGSVDSSIQYQHHAD